MLITRKYEDYIYEIYILKESNNRQFANQNLLNGNKISSCLLINNNMHVSASLNFRDEFPCLLDADSQKIYILAFIYKTVANVLIQKINYLSGITTILALKVIQYDQMTDKLIFCI